jgi:hypothetical protein
MTPKMAPHAQGLRNSDIQSLIGAIVDCRQVFNEAGPRREAAQERFNAYLDALVEKSASTTASGNAPPRVTGPLGQVHAAVTRMIQICEGNDEAEKARLHDMQCGMLPHLKSLFHTVLPGHPYLQALENLEADTALFQNRMLPCGLSLHD